MSTTAFTQPPNGTKFTFAPHEPHSELREIPAKPDRLGKLNRFGKKLASPRFLAGAATVAAVQKEIAPNGPITDALNKLLLLKHLEADFYQSGLEAKVIPIGSQERAFMQMFRNEIQYAEYLEYAIDSLEGIPVARPGFDFTTKGFYQPFQSYNQFLALAQVFEDAGVGSCQQQAGVFINNVDIAAAVRQLASVEARHAARVRSFRWLNNWGSCPYSNSKAVYAEEDQAMMAGKEVTAIVSLFLA